MDWDQGLLGIGSIPETSPFLCIYFPLIKNLLDHLEEKMPVEDEVMPPQALSEQTDEAGAALSSLSEVPPWTGEVNPSQRDGGALGRSPWDPSDRSALLKSKLRALLAGPRSLRRSSCFGGRIDRIGAQSGLGCNSFRVRGAAGGNGIEARWGLVRAPTLPRTSASLHLRQYRVQCVSLMFSESSAPP